MVELPWLCVLLCDMHVDLTRISIVGLFMYMLLTFMHKAFISKLHTLMKCPLLAWFYGVCSYGIILSTSGVLTPFSPFPQHFRFWSLEGFWDDFEGRLGILINQSWVGPHFPRAMPISSYEVVLVLRHLCFILFIWILNVV